MPAPLAPLLESLSGYRPAFPLTDPRASQNPVNYSHVRAAAGGKNLSVLSRVADYGLDYSQRTNKIAHHVVLASDERPEAGPAWLLAQPGFMDARWDGQPRTLPAGRRVPSGTERPTRCATWAALTGDAGWAGVLAEGWLSGTATYVIFEPGTDTLGLIREAIALLPPRKRWEATFATYYTGMPSGVVCGCRCVVDGSQEAIQATRLANVVTIAVNRRVARAQGGNLVEAARTGNVETPALSGGVSRTASGSQFAPLAASNSVSISRPASDSHSRAQYDSSAINAPTARRAQAEPPPVRVSRLPPDARRRSRAWIWWLSGSLTAVLALGAGLLFAFRPPPPKESGQVAAVEKPGPPAVANPLPPAAAKPEGKQQQITERKDARREAVEPRREPVESEARGADTAQQDGDSPAKQHAAAPPAQKNGNKPPPSPIATGKPRAADSQKTPQKGHAVGDAVIADKSRAPATPTTTNIRPNTRKPGPDWPAFLGNDSIKSIADGPIEIAGFNASKRYLLAAWLPDGAPLGALPDKPAEKIVIAVKALTDITTTFSTTADHDVLKLVIASQNPDLGAARYALLEVSSSDRPTNPHYFQLFRPRSTPSKPQQNRKLENQKLRIFAEWPLPVSLDRRALPGLRADFLTLSAAGKTIRFVPMSAKAPKGQRSSTLVPDEADSDFFAATKTPKLFLDYVGMTKDSSADVVAVMAYKWSDELMAGNTRLCAQAGQTLHKKLAKLDDLRDALKHNRQTLERTLAKQKEPDAKTKEAEIRQTEFEIREVRDLQARLNRWDEISRILGNPDVTSARIGYDTSRGEQVRKATLVDFETKQLEVRK
jgi:hypothetical protein